MNAMRKRVFTRWCIVLAALWVFANWPTGIGIAGLIKRVGFPLPFAWGVGGFEHFDGIALLVDLIVGMAVVVGLPWLCAWSRKSPNERREPIE
jgi:hypothetical protein